MLEGHTSILWKDMKIIIFLTQTIHKDKYGKKLRGSEPCLTPKTIGKKMLVFYCGLNWMYVQAWLQNTESLESQKTFENSSLLPGHGYISPSFLALFPFFFLNYPDIEAFSCWLSLFYYFYFCFCPFNLSFPPLFLSEQLQTNSPFLLPHHCCILIQTTMNFSTHKVHISDLFCVWPVVAPIVSAAS